jgi:ribose transport system substrate-binding protein
MKKSVSTAARFAAVSVSLTVLAACGSDGSDDGRAAPADGPSASSAAGGASDAVAAAAEAVEVNFAGTDRPLPSQGPKPLADQNVWVISCSQAALGCATVAAGAEEAGEALGWDVKIVDGKFNPAAFTDGIRQAVAADADAVILGGVDCSLTKSAIEQAKAAGVKVYGVWALDCDDKYAGGGEPLFDAELSYGNDFANYAEQIEAAAATQAQYAIAKTEGKANVLVFRQEDTAVLRHITDGFDAELAKCEECKTHDVGIAAGDLATGAVQGKAAAGLAANPDVNVVMGTYDALILLGVGPAVAASGKDPILLGTEGLAPNVGMIGAGGPQDFAVGVPARWTGWAAIDGVNRLLQGEPQADSGIGWKNIDADHLPQGDEYDGTVDYQANYRKLWGLAS